MFASVKCKRRINLRSIFPREAKWKSNQIEIREILCNRLQTTVDGNVSLKVIIALNKARLRVQLDGKHPMAPDEVGENQ